MSVKIKFKKFPAQRECFDDDLTKLLLFSGGLGSGKSHYLCMKAIKLSKLNRNHPGGFLVPTYADYDRDIHPLFEQIFEENKISHLVRFHQTKKTWHFKWTKAPLYIFTGEKPIAGPNLAYCLINEFSLIRYVRVKEMLRRVRLKKPQYKQKCLAGTPEDVHGWLEEFIDAQDTKEEKKPGSFKIVFADTNENTEIDEDYRDDLESMLDEQSLKVFASGQIVRIGTDYFYYSFDRKKCVDKTIKRKRGEIIHASMDFNVGKMACGLSNKFFNEETRKYEQHFFDEILLVGNSDTYDMGMAIINRYGIIKESYTKDEWLKIDIEERELKLSHIVITCDTSGKNRKTTGLSDVKALRLLGFTVRHKSSNPRMKQRQLMVNGLMSHSRIKVHPKCKGIIRDFEKVQQNKMDLTKIKDKDDRLTHFSDGADYLLDWEYGQEYKDLLARGQKRTMRAS